VPRRPGRWGERGRTEGNCVREGVMSARKWAVEIGFAFATTLLVSVVVTFVWNLATRAEAVADWETSFVMAVVLGIALPLTHARRSARRDGP